MLCASNIMCLLIVRSHGGYQKVPVEILVSVLTIFGVFILLQLLEILSVLISG